MRSVRLSVILVLLILQSTYVGAAPQSTASVSSKSLQQRTSKLTVTGPEYEAYQQKVRKQWANNNYEWLENEARKLSGSKERLPGGYWKLRVLYKSIEALTNSESSDESWQEHIARVEHWARQRPTSAMPRIILAEVWRAYGWKARGTGRANTLKPENWAPFNDRHEKTSKFLAEAAALEEKSPEWYVTALLAARVQRPDREAFERLYADAVGLEPYYYYLYQAKAGYLLPQWYGEAGEWERFAEITANQVGGEQGDIILFTIYSEMLSHSSLEFMETRRAIAPRLIAGFRAIDKLYGSSPQRLNEACLISLFADDNTIPAELMKRIGNAYDVNVWKDASTFNIFRQEALMRSGELPRYRQP
jgi:hypothetical protein